MGWASAAIAAALSLASFNGVVGGQQPARTAAASALPSDRLHFGLTNDPSDLGWMTGSGVPWRYRYVYLAGGVNTSNPWQNWNSPTGAYATNYMNASGANGYIPVFTYYEMLQSNPSTGSTESDRDFSNLNNAGTMAAYYANFKLLMQVAGSYGKTVVVHVEPDLWGYLEQRAAGGDASTLNASVASSGFSEAGGLPNTVQGFAWTLLKLRDLYAPNAILAIHASAWGSGIDIASDTNPSVNAGVEADKTAAFLNSAGIASNPYGSTWDLVFNDVDDHDAGWWEQQGADNQYFTHWWDPTNATYPNFSRYLAWVAELHAKTARPQVVWQVPIGNQYFLTMNNTCGHYQDNVAPYFIAHPTDLFAAGLIAVLFGAGNSCQTTNTDAMNDGVTNNSGTPTSDAPGHCNACNTHVSTWADDDGGFLRIFVGAYYSSGWASLNGVLVSGPAAASWGASRSDVFAVGGDRGLWQVTSSAGTWGSWTPLGGIVTADPGAVSWGNGRIDVLVRGQDGALYHRGFNGTSWLGWEGLGGGLNYGPAVSSWGPSRLDVFVVGLDGRLWHRYFDGQSWAGWEPLGGVLTSDPGAVSWAGNRIDIFARGSDNQMWHMAWAGGWTGWQPMSGLFTTGAASASCASGHLDVYSVGFDHGLWHDAWNGSSWSGWSPLGGYWTSTPGAVCTPGTTTVQLFERGPDSAIWHFSTSGT